MPDDIQLRTAIEADYDTLGDVMFDAIHNRPSKYTEAQLLAWAPAPKRGPDWHARLGRQSVIVAERDGETLGFISIELGGYIDFVYIRPRAQGHGLFRRLFVAILNVAYSHGETVLSTDASLMAQPAFAAMGFRVDYHERVVVDGQSLPRARMTKTL
ncbi:MAG: GNAT family N-acetyltransferase [Pseudomonadota bacterium]